MWVRTNVFLQEAYFKIIVVTLLFAFFVRWFVIDVDIVSDVLMEPTIKKNSLVFSLNKYSFLDIEYRKNMLLIYNHPQLETEKLSRIIALGGDSVVIFDHNFIVNQEEIISNTRLEKSYLIQPRFYSLNYVVPKKGDIVLLDSLNLREVDMLYNIIKQNDPHQKYTSQVYLLIDGKRATADDFKKYIDVNAFFGIDYKFSALSWFSLLNIEKQLSLRFPYQSFHFKKEIFLNNNLVSSYLIPQKCFFVLDDNFNEGIDSRYFGSICESQIENLPFYIN